MSSKQTYTLGLVAALLLSACGGSGGGPALETFSDVLDRPSDTVSDDPPIVAAPTDTELPADPFDAFGTEEPEEDEPDGSELELTLSESEEATIALTGLAIVVEDSATGERVIVLRNGSYVKEDDTRTLNDNPLTLTSDVPGTFAFASSYFQADGPGIVGISVDVEAMPDEGTAVFMGGATGFVITGDAGVDLTNGQSEVNVDFATGSVSVDLTDFQSISQVSGNLVSAPFETINWTGAVIEGAGFERGTVTVDGATPVSDIIGANGRLTAQGQFFGQVDGIDIPAEVGGLIYGEGDDGVIFGEFIAD